MGPVSRNEGVTGTERAQATGSGSRECPTSPADGRRLPKLLYTAEEVAAMFGKTARTIRDLCFERQFPYRLETRWIGPGRCQRLMVFSMREIQVLLDHFAPPVEQIVAWRTDRQTRRRATPAHTPATED